MMNWLIYNFDRVLIGVVCLSLLALGAGCAALTSNIPEADEANTGGAIGKAEVDASVLKAEVGRVIGVQKEIQQNTYQKIEAQGNIAMYAATGSAGAILIVLMQTVQEMWREWLNRPDRKPPRRSIYPPHPAES